MKATKKHKAPGYVDLLLDTLKLIASRGGSASIGEIHDGIVERRNFEDDVVDELHPGSTVTTELEYNLAWARTYLRKNGLILRSKNGVWALTKLGAEASKKDTIGKKAIVKGAVAAQKDDAAGPDGVGAGRGSRPRPGRTHTTAPFPRPTERAMPVPSSSSCSSHCATHCSPSRRVWETVW